MSDKAEVISLAKAAAEAPYAAARRQLTELLVRYSLIDSFFNFTSAGKPYPFTRPEEVLPHLAMRRVEYGQQNTALMVLMDGTLPRTLNKHFRLRASNRVSWRNIQRLAPRLDMSDFKAAHCRFDQPEFEALLNRLLPLDYMLVAERAGERGGPGAFALAHMYVKVERLTDNAIKELGRKLGYIERRLFERGEDYVEALEAKFFEYHGFSIAAAGRKTAAAMAAQLLAAQGGRFTVFVAGQEDCRLTLLDHSDTVTQYLLIRLAGTSLKAFRRRAERLEGADAGTYAVTGSADGPLTVVYRLKLQRTAAARPSPQRRADRDLMQPWLEVVEQAIVPRPGSGAPEIPFTWIDNAA